MSTLVIVGLIIAFGGVLFYAVKEIGNIKVE